MTQNLSREEVEACIQFKKLSRIKYLKIRRRDLDKLAPEMDDKFSEYDNGEIDLHDRGVNVRTEPRRAFRIAELGEEPKLVDNDYESYTYQYNYNFFNEISNKLGFDRMMELFSENLDRHFEALSTGQAHAIIKKLFPRARDDGKTLSSTTRSQLQQIKDKITKYQPLVLNLGPLFISMNDQYVNKHGPMVGYAPVQHPNKTEWMDNIRDARSHLEKTPPRLDEREDEEQKKIKQIKLAAIEQGIYQEPQLPEESYFFMCHWCDYTKPLDPSKSVEEQHQSHHGKPMFLRAVRSQNSDY